MHVDFRVIFNQILTELHQSTSLGNFRTRVKKILIEWKKEVIEYEKNACLGFLVYELMKQEKHPIEITDIETQMKHKQKIKQFSKISDCEINDRILLNALTTNGFARVRGRSTGNVELVEFVPHSDVNRRYELYSQKLESISLTSSVSSTGRDEKGRFAKGNHIGQGDWTSPIISSLKDLNLKGIEVVCPVCNKKGTVVTKWINGKPFKPIFIFHFKNGDFEKKCEINERNSEQIRKQVKVLKADINELIKKRRSFLLFSGGKDSIATLLYLKKITPNIDDLTVVHVDTTAGLPENTEYVKEVCEYLDVQLEIVRPKRDYFTLAKEWGIPSFGFRWCCRELKIKPITEYFNNITEPKVVFDGIRAAESNIRKKYIPIWYHPSFKCLSVSAIFHWSDKQVYSSINGNGIPKTYLHSLGTSSECWCGAYKTETDFKKLYGINKEMFYKLANLEENSKTNYTFLYNNGEKKTLWDLESQILNS